MESDTTQRSARQHLLTAALAEERAVERVEVVEVTLAPRQAAGLHLHPCPVVGCVLAGSIRVQVEGQPAQVLGPGDAFYEPADTPVPHFDNLGDEPARFVACYLLGAGQHELIRML
ncbi:cupin domain-containing protein [Chloroflexia bacterium SDU3-3]|nr:cupin domain-containing protein [Chloroflexia bacterium SDU3-3]